MSSVESGCPHIECSSKLTSKSNFTNSHVVASARMLAGASTASNSVASCRSSWGSRQQVAVTCSFPVMCSLLHAHASSCVVGGTTELEPELAEETWKAQALKSYRQNSKNQKRLVDTSMDINEYQGLLSLPGILSRRASASSTAEIRLAAKISTGRAS